MQSYKLVQQGRQSTGTLFSIQSSYGLPKRIPGWDSPVAVIHRRGLAVVRPRHSDHGPSHGGFWQSLRWQRHRFPCRNDHEHADCSSEHHRCQNLWRECCRRLYGSHHMAAEAAIAPWGKLYHQCPILAVGCGNPHGHVVGHRQRLQQPPDGRSNGRRPSRDHDGAGQSNVCQSDRGNNERPLADHANQ